MQAMRLACEEARLRQEAAEEPNGSDRIDFRTLLVARMAWI